MTSSGTYNFSPSVGQILLAAYARLQIRRASLLQEHMTDGFNETNFLFSQWSNLQPSLFTVDLVTVPLVQGTATYNVDTSTVMILDAYIEYGNPTTDRLIFPISRTEYASYPNKQQQGFPTVFWFDRLISPTITLWLVPDQNGPYTLKYYRCTQNQDANLPSGETPAIPYRFIDAMVAGLAHRLSRIWKPEMEQMRKADADEAWRIAAGNDVENVSLFLSPGLSSYYR